MFSLRGLFEGGKEFPNGELGNGRWPLIPLNVAVVGVVADWSFGGSLFVTGGGCEDACTGALGVVGVVASPP